MEARKGQENWRRIVYFDSESTLVEGKEKLHHKPRLICAEFWRMDLTDKMVAQKDYTGKTLCADFYRDLDGFAVGKETVRVFAHNVGYDLLATGGIVHLANLGWRVDSLYEKGFTYILRMVKQNRRLIFLSSTQFWRAPLAQVAKMFGMEKMENKTGGAIHQTPDEELLKQYCRNDVAILRTAMNWVMEFVEANDLGSMGSTLPSLAMNSYRHRFMPYEIEIHNYLPALLLEREAYYGGRVEAFFVGKAPEKLYKLDINSMYPAMMARWSYPTKLLAFYPEGTPELLREHYYDPTKFIIAQVEVDTKIPAYPYRDPKGGKLLFPIGKFRTTLSGAELHKAMVANEITQVFAVSVYAAHGIFTDFVTFFYAQREAAKAKGDEAAAMFWKLLMNSLYGKFGQQSTDWIQVGDADPTVVKTEKVLWPDGRLVTLRTFGGKVMLNDGRVMESFDSFTAIAAGVTSYARAHLDALIEKAGRGNVYYCDTDSLFVNAAGLARLHEEIDPLHLGRLKFEAESDDVVIRGAKDYTWGGKVTQKGIPKNAEVIMTPEGPKAKVWQWPKIASALREGDLSQFSNRLVIKDITTRYEKGLIGEDGRVSPFVLPEE